MIERSVGRIRERQIGTNRETHTLPLPLPLSVTLCLPLCLSPCASLCLSLSVFLSLFLSTLLPIISIPSFFYLIFF